MAYNYFSPNLTNIPGDINPPLMAADVNKRRASSPILTDVQKRYLWSTEDLIKTNQFYVLETQVSDAIPQTSSSSQATVPSPPKVKIPPIFLAPANYNEVVSDLKKLTKHEFSTKNTSGQIRINLMSAEDYRAVTKFFATNKINHYTYQDPTTKPLSVVIKNVPVSLDTQYIETELTSANLPIKKVTRILNKQKQPSLTVAVELENNEQGKKIFKLEKLCYAIVRVEARKYGAHVP